MTGLWAALGLGLVWGGPVFAQQGAAPESWAVLSFESAGASPAEVSAVTDRLQDLLTDTRKVAVAERARVDAVLASPEYRREACAGSECARKLGKLLGVSKVVQGKITKLDETHWVIAASLVGVGQADLLMAPSVPFEGRYFLLLQSGVPILVTRLTAGSAAPSVAGTALRLPEQIVSETGREGFDRYVGSKGQKAFAVSATGAWGMASGRAFLKDAEQGAIAFCQKNTKLTCVVVATNDQMVDPPPAVPAVQAPAETEEEAHSGPKQGFGIAIGGGSESGTLSADTSSTYSGHGSALQVDYQWRLSSRNSVDLFINELSAGPSSSLGADFRVWAGQAFLGGRIGFAQTTFTVEGTNLTTTASGPTVGVVAGYEARGGFELLLSLTTANMKGTFLDTSYTVTETRTMYLLGYRF